MIQPMHFSPFRSPSQPTSQHWPTGAKKDEDDQLWTKAEWSSQPHCLERPSQYYIHYHRHQGKSCKLTIFTMIHSYPLNITTINTDTRVNVGRDACSSHPKGKNPRPKPFAGARRRPLFRGWIAKPLITFWEYILVIKPSHTAPLPCLGGVGNCKKIQSSHNSAWWFFGIFRTKKSIAPCV